MKANNLTVAIASALIGAGSVVSLQAVAQHDQHTGHPTATQKSGTSAQIHKVMSAPMGYKMTGDVDRDFAGMMAAHHANAIKAGQLELKHGKSAELKDLTKKMIAAQTKERQELLKHAAMKH